MGEAINIKLHDGVMRWSSPIRRTMLLSRHGWRGWQPTGASSMHMPPTSPTTTRATRVSRKIGAEVGPVDILVNNAGITRDASFKKLDKINWDAVIRTNLDSVFNMTKPVCDGMVERG